jgi:transcription initiation factor TFIIIB Brf1 subunit/transcription initiation factor TFIIB
MKEDLFLKLNSIIESEHVPKEEEEKTICTHENIVNDLKSITCKDCGIQLSKDCSFDKEWRYYGSMNNRFGSDPTRCTFRKSTVEQRGLISDVEKYKFKRQIVYDANEIYESVTNKKIFRGNKRRGIVFACIYHAFNKNDNPLSCETLIHLFDIQNNIALRGLKFVNINLAVDSPLRVKKSQNDIYNLINEIMTAFHASPSQIKETLELYTYLTNKSSLLNRSRPGSVAAAIVKYYILKKNPNFSSDFLKYKIRLSELTLTRITREIDLILS